MRETSAKTVTRAASGVAAALNGDVIRRAAIESLERGETFYSQNLGLPELRESLAGYMSSLHPPVDAGRVVVTSGGVNGLMLAAQALVDAGDEVVVVTPVWPNLVAQPAIMGATTYAWTSEASRASASGPGGNAWTSTDWNSPLRRASTSPMSRTE